MVSTPEIIVRLLAALLFCGLVGLQRALTGKAAGMRTHILVGVGSALFTLISGYAFHTTASNADRIAAQVVSGIGFIGGGAILKEHGSIKGLTTAAGLWVAAALGMAAGAGLYVMGVTATALVLLTLVALRYVEVRFPRRSEQTWAIRVTLSAEGSIESMRGAIRPYCRRLSLVGMTQGEQTRLTFVASMPHHSDIVALAGRLRAAGATAVVWDARGDAETEEGP